MLRRIALTSLLMLPVTTMANSETPTLKPMVQFGYDFGGKTLATVYNDYDGTTKVRAGSGARFEVGAMLTSPQNPLELQFLVGYKFEGETASNGDVTWDSIPFTALAMFKNKKWKFGGGVTYHLNPYLSGSFSGYDNTGTYFNDAVNDRYDNALGGVAQIDYMATDNFAVGLRGTYIEYKLKNDPSVTANGNSIGFNLSYAFGERSEFR